MSFWGRVFGTPNHTGVTANANDTVAPPDVIGNGYSPGDPDGFELIEPDDVEGRSLSWIAASPWAGWPGEWSTPTWGGPGLCGLVDTAWACLDLNSSVLSTMPVYRLRDGRVVEPATWMINPDPTVYSSWHEFAKQLFWDYQMGEAFVLATDYFNDGTPMFFRVIPPCYMKVEIAGGIRSYKIGTVDVTADILHIRYKSTSDGAHGVGPLDAGGARITAACALARYVSQVASTGGVPYLTLETEQALNAADAQDLLDQWVTSRQANVGRPAVLDSGVKAVPHQMSPRDMALIEVAQFNDARIAVLLGVPPFLVALSTGDSMTYSNVEQIFGFHDRSSLRPKAANVMSALSQWALPPNESAELDRDEYSRPALAERANAYQVLHSIGVMTTDEIRQRERLIGPAADVRDVETAPPVEVTQ